MKIRTKFIISLIIVAVIVLIVCFVTPTASLYSTCKFYYGKEIAKEMLLPTSSDDKKTARSIMDKVGAAFSFVESEKAAEKEYGILSRFCNYDPKTASISTNIDLKKAKFGDSSGYIWFEYYNQAYDKNGNELSGSGSPEDPILVKLYLEKTQDGWEVTDVLEAP